MKKLLSLFLLLCIICPIFAGCSLDVDNIGDVINDAYDIVGEIIDYAGESAGKTDKAPQSAVSIDDVGEFAGEPYITVNGNKPSFSATELTTEAYELYSDLDILGRCGYAMACIGVELMPTEERGSIGQVKPSGWQTVKYDIVDGKYLYNRCHLIGFQLTGENANTKNLITGTRYMNVDGMLPFENMVADYIKDTENHVLYRVTPIFQELELVARGVQIEAYSVEDNGEGICFNVYVYNNQPGIVINYLTGASRLATDDESEAETTPPVTAITQAPTTTAQKEEPSVYGTYILNVNSKKFHLTDCSSVKAMSETNKRSFEGNRADLIADGYTPCGVCKP